jgi:hypothetical protein
MLPQDWEQGQDTCCHHILCAIVLQILATVIRQGKEILGTQNGKEGINLYLFESDMISICAKS